MGWSRDQYSVTFQSRLGSDPWLTPFTDETLEHMPSQGIKDLVVLCPAFIADCLETLEEINMEGRHEFMEAGGKRFRYIPCLNDDEVWIDTLAKLYDEYLASRVVLHRLET